MAARKQARNSSSRRSRGTIDVKIHPPKSGHVVCEVSTEEDGITLFCRRRPVSERSALGEDLEADLEEAEASSAEETQDEEDEGEDGPTADADAEEEDDDAEE